VTWAEKLRTVPALGNLLGSEVSTQQPAFSKPKMIVLFFEGPLSVTAERCACLTLMIRSYKGISPTVPDSCYVDESAQIIGDVVLGEHASVWMNAVLRGDVHSIRIGAYSNIQDCSVLHGMKEKYGVFVGEYVTVGHAVTLHGCNIGDRCLIGMGSLILNGAWIGHGSIIAAGTVILEKTVVEAGSLWAGSPGQFKRKLTEKDQEGILRYATNYLGYKDSYLAERK
jgi:carbonic anhydrase/acetyltransferase-like protein (isoleucine patch superfamily)